MKILSLLVLLLSLFVVGCSESYSFRDLPQKEPVKLEGFGTAVESATFYFNGDEYFAYNPTTTHLVYLKNLRTSETTALPFPARFFYFVSYQGILYAFYQNNMTIYFRSTSDLVSWSSEAVSLSPEGPTSIYNQMWNVAVQVDSLGQWHLLVECSDSALDQVNVGLSYMVSNSPVFETAKTHFMDIPGGGNPEMKIIPEGLVSIHGLLVNGYWEIHYSKYLSSWSSPKPLIKKDLIHVADPNVKETSSGLWISYSYDQNSLYVLETNYSYRDLFLR